MYEYSDYYSHQHQGLIYWMITVYIAHHQARGADYKDGPRAHT